VHIATHIEPRRDRGSEPRVPAAEPTWRRRDRQLLLLHVLAGMRLPGLVVVAFICASASCMPHRPAHHRDPDDRLPRSTSIDDGSFPCDLDAARQHIRTHGKIGDYCWMRCDRTAPLPCSDGAHCLLSVVADEFGKACPGMPEGRNGAKAVCASPDHYTRLWVGFAENFEEVVDGRRVRVETSDHVHCIRDSDCAQGMTCDCSKNDLQGIRRYECARPTEPDPSLYRNAY
jgi:hypothetical protein